MAKPAPDTHTTNARTWQAHLADGRTIQFSSPAEQLAARLANEAHTEHTTIVTFAPTFPTAGWLALRPAVMAKLVGNGAMKRDDATITVHAA